VIHALRRPLALATVLAFSVLALSIAARMTRADDAQAPISGVYETSIESTTSKITIRLSGRNVALAGKEDDWTASYDPAAKKISAWRRVKAEDLPDVDANGTQLSEPAKKKAIDQGLKWTLDLEVKDESGQVGSKLVGKFDKKEVRLNGDEVTFSSKPIDVSYEKTAQVEPLKACCSCLTALKLVLKTNSARSLEDLSKPPQPANQFKISIDYYTKKSASQGDLVLRWLERADRVPSTTLEAFPQAEPGRWYNVIKLQMESTVPYTTKEGRRTTIGEAVKTAGGTVTDWLKYLEGQDRKSCRLGQKETKKPLEIADTPAASKERKLDFDITVGSAPGCGCDIPALEIKASQALRNNPRSGMIDQSAANSGFFGPNGKLKRDEEIAGQPPPVGEPAVPAH
jgi:hypothetical protein